MTNPVNEEKCAGDDRDGPGSRPSDAADDRDQPPEPVRQSCAGGTGEPNLSIALSEGVETGNEQSESADLSWIELQVHRLLPLLSVQASRISIEIVDDARMTHLHEQYCGERSTTDVLTFPADDDSTVIDADIAVCVDEAARRGAERGHGVNRELLLYILHGLLHCCGYDDHDEASYRAIHMEEDRLLEAIGVGKVFHSASSGHDDDAADAQRDTGIDGWSLP